MQCGGSMKYVIAVFSSRSETLSFFRYMNKLGYFAVVITTPKVASKTCGISVKFSYEDFEKVKQILTSLNFSTFLGFYL